MAPRRRPRRVQGPGDCPTFPAAGYLDPWATTRLQAHAIDQGLPPPETSACASLSPLQRFALFKLSRPGHDNDKFEPAMREFGLLGAVGVTASRRRRLC